MLGTERSNAASGAERSVERSKAALGAERGHAVLGGGLLSRPDARAAGPAPSGEVFNLDPTEATFFALAQAVEQRDSLTAGHCERLAFTGVALGMAMGLDSSQLVNLYRGGYLHDVGKVGIPDAILHKSGKLSEEEWVVMRTHPVRGEEICCNLPSLRAVLPIIRHHHERWDGSGYPDGLRGSEIPILARIVQVADIYDALVSVRPYKAAFSQAEALRIMQDETDRGWIDPQIMTVFSRMHDKVIAHLADFSGGMDPNLESLRMALAGLDNAA